MASHHRSILFVTNSELGQANVALAVAEEFLLHAEFAVHIASFRPLAASVDELNKRYPSAQPAQFHEIHGPSMEQLAVRSSVGLLHHRPGVMGAVEGFQKVNRAISSWTPSEYSEAYQSCLDILNDLRPAVVCIDPIMQVAIDACQNSTLRFRVVVLWPVPLKDVVIMNQPNGKLFWKYPMTGSGYSYPLPWTSILPNVYIALRAALSMGTRNPPTAEEPEGKERERTPFPIKSAYSNDSLQLTPSFQQMDFPFHIPPNVISCGPILRRHRPLSESDPEMEAWLSCSTILISLGSHVKPSERIALEMAKGIHAVLSKHPHLKVLWKLRYEWNESESFKKILGTLIENGSVMVIPWIPAEIISVLETGRIVVYVHHGGANSYFEACKVGAPQVVLPQWLDTYDCATRVEWLGIGVHGSRKTAPEIEAVEFAAAIDRVLSDEKIRSRAASMKELCKSTEGRTVAHDMIVKFAG